MTRRPQHTRLRRWLPLGLALVLALASASAGGAAPRKGKRSPVEVRAGALLRERAAVLFERKDYERADRLLVIARELHEAPETRLLHLRTLVALNRCPAAVRLARRVSPERLPKDRHALLAELKRQAEERCRPPERP